MKTGCKTIRLLPALALLLLAPYALFPQEAEKLPQAGQLQEQQGAQKSVQLPSPIPPDHYQGDSFEINENLQSGTYDFEARDYVRMGHGFKYTRDGSNTFRARLNENLLFDITYQDIPDMERDLDTNKAVGSTTANYNVSSTGGATYSIPIYTPKGTQGMQPQISLVYNSQSGNSIAGLGWSIGGLSVIARTPQNIFYDGIVEGVNLNSNDKFSLDGKRLLQISASGSIIEYAFEIEDFSRIEYNTTNLTFTLKLKNGTIIEYGCAGNSKLIPENSSTPFAYYINKITDRNGNFMEYIYNNDVGECVIKEIKYTGNTNASVQPYNSIKFYYSIRADKNKLYVADKWINSTKILRKIKVYSNEQLVRTYNLSYHNEIYSQLTEIEEVGRNNEKVNSTIIQYGRNGILYVEEPSTFNQNSQLTFIQGDFNGDGKSDIVAAITNYFFGMKQLSNYTIADIENELNSGNSFSNLCYISNSQNSFLGNAPGSYIADFNGDNIEDIALLDVSSYGSFTYCLLLGYIPYYSYDGCFNEEEKQAEFVGLNNIKIYKGGNGFSIQNITVDGIYNYFNPEKKFFYTGDFNGDGLSDYITVLNAGLDFLLNTGIDNPANYQITYVIPQTNSSNIISGISPFTLLDADTTYIIDFNGNGKQDIMVVFPDKIEIYELNLSGTTYTLDLLYTSVTLNSDFEFLFGDFNGDGKTDFYTYGESIPSANWKFKYSTGTDFEDKLFQPASDLNVTYKFVTGDFNGDGKSDLLYAFGYSYNPSFFNIVIYYSNGKSFVSKSYTFQESMGEKLIPGDFDADGSHDLLNFTTDGNNRKVLFFNKYTVNIEPENARPLFVTKIIDGFNNWAEFEYTPITHHRLYVLCCDIQQGRQRIYRFSENGILSYYN
ncbi:MAG: VCBS repeat-containing protein [Bacteroidia bacterium]|nr:VCBS repeat-containing protein [Bacteroidia bacterium]